MLTVLIATGALILGIGIGGAVIVRQVRSGRIVVGGEVYLCKYTGRVKRH